MSKFGRKKAYADNKKTGKQAIGYLQVYSLELNGEIKWYKSRLEALRVCDENNLDLVKCYSILQDKPAYMFLNFLNGNYSVEEIPMKRSRNYQGIKQSRMRHNILANRLREKGIDLNTLTTEELRAMVEE